MLEEKELHVRNELAIIICLKLFVACVLQVLEPKLRYRDNPWKNVHIEGHDHKEEAKYYWCISKVFEDFLAIQSRSFACNASDMVEDYISYAKVHE